VITEALLRVGLEPCAGYRLRELRGQCSFGCVWEAETSRGQAVALKFLSCADGITTRQEIRAIQRVSQLRHAHLVPVEQVWCWQNYVVVTMPLADGSLLDLLEAYQDEYGGAMTCELACFYLAQAAEGLDFLNARQHEHDGRLVGFQHCDIKPSNLLLFEDTVKIADFGLATPTSFPLKMHRRAGTPDYMAQEIFQGRISDWSDQHALAVTWCQLRTGHLPFPESDSLEARANLRVADLSLLAPVERPIIRRALSLLPQNRWPSCGEMIEQLRAVAK